MNNIDWSEEIFNNKYFQQTLSTFFKENLTMKECPDSPNSGMSLQLCGKEIFKLRWADLFKMKSFKAFIKGEIMDYVQKNLTLDKDSGLMCQSVILKGPMKLGQVTIYTR